MDLRKQPRHVRRAAEKHLEQDRLKWPTHLVPVPHEQWPEGSGRKMPTEIWRSRNFLLQVFPWSDSVVRLSICRTAIQRDGNWQQEITWDELQDLKRQCGMGDHDAVEIYPADSDVVNVANMRHLWVLKDHDLDFIWRRKE